MNIRNLVVEETSNMDQADAAGVIEVPPGTTKTILEYRNKENYLLLSTGATDQPDCTFQLEHGNDPVYNQESPLGTITQPFGFAEKFGEPLECSDDLKLKVTNNGSSAQKFAARWQIGERQ